MTKYRLNIQVTTRRGTTYTTGATWSFDGPVTTVAIEQAEDQLTKIQNVKRTTILSWCEIQE